jgi:HD-like signal output (HDOD) protein/ActR/RegA family two-component response regulator
VSATVPSSAELRRVLFVDDEGHVLEALRDALRSYRGQWAMSFVRNAREALELLSAEHHDVVISDLLMPELDGATLLERVRDRHPTTVRIVLSGHADLEMVARAAGVAHRLIAKPCDTGDLARVIEGSCALQQMTARLQLRGCVAGASSLPSLPRLYAELTELLASGDASARDAARVIQSDMAMAAKVLQLANSAYFGRRHPVSQLVEAVAYLGLEPVRALVLHAEGFRHLRVDPPIPGFDLEELQLHCTRVARVARSLLADPRSGADAFAAGLLHDVGLLILAAQDRDELTRMLAASRERSRPLYEVERERHGVTHGEIGAHLLALWGLPQGITDAVAHHHGPPSSTGSFDAIAATYVANILVEEIEAGGPTGGLTAAALPAGGLPAGALDEEYLEQAALSSRLPEWRALARRECGVAS